MPPATRPRRRLPARVYWVRRALVLTVALALVWGVAHLLGSSNDTAPGTAARTVGSESTPTAPPATRTAPVPTLTARPGARQQKAPSPTPTPVVLASPSGPCTTSDVIVDPGTRGTAYAGRSVVFTMNLTTRVSPACTFDVSARSLVVRVTSGQDRIWSTQECAGAVPKESVVVRDNQPTTVTVAWNGQRSDADCSRATSWAEPGWYHVAAAVIGADPVDQQFRLADPVPATITATPTPKHTPSGSASPSASASR